MINLDDLKNAMAELDADIVNTLLDEVMKDGGSQAQEAMTACQDGLKIVGERFEAAEYFVVELIYAGELMTGALQKLRSALVSNAGGSEKGRLILCTVQGDLHDIGKNIVKAIFEAASFEVIDMGIDVAPEKIIACAKENDIHIVALSGVLTLAIESMKKTVDAFKEAGLRETIKVIVGGSPISAENAAYIGADAWAHNPYTGVGYCKNWI
jgi:methylmalonyl-CoA mutase cobalamin-binding domain/chain